MGFTSCYLIVMRVLLNLDQQIGHTLGNKTEICNRQIFRDSMKSQTVSCSVVSNSATPWTVAHQAPLSTGLSRQEYWSRWPFPSLGDLSDPGIEPASPGLLGFLLSEPPGKPGPVEIQPALPSLRVLLLLCFCPAPAILTIPPRIQLFYFIS